MLRASMVQSLPRWVWCGAALLALIAGIVNAVGFLGFEHQGVTHLTGITTQLGIAVAEREVGSVVHLGAVIGSFMVGCVLAGFVIRDGTARLGRRYGIALMTESALLFLAVPLLRHGSSGGDYLASCACGVQNGMVSTFGGAVLRTTHVTGAISDLGVSLGHLFAGLPVERHRVTLFSVLIVAFCAGGAIGALAYARFGSDTVIGPAVLTGATGALYFAYRMRHPLPLDTG
jgi:uncharacterized membrane protein YoaK (UPF0700 family)